MKVLINHMTPNEIHNIIITLPKENKAITMKKMKVRSDHKCNI